MQGMRYLWLVALAGMVQGQQIQYMQQTNPGPLPKCYTLHYVDGETEKVCGLEPSIGDDKHGSWRYPAPKKTRHALGFTSQEPHEMGIVESTACAGCVTLRVPSTSFGTIRLNPTPDAYWWAAMNADGSEAVRCTYGQNGKPGECSDKTHKVPFPVSCDAPKDGYFTNCRIVDAKP